MSADTSSPDTASRATTLPSAANPLAHQPMGHLPVLDGLRGVAIATVFLVHLYSPVFPGGGSGVMLFFVLSGFLITKLALEEADRTGGLSLSQFYLRRLFRIFPPLFVMLAFLLVASFTFMSGVGEPLRREIALAGGSMGNLWPVFYGFEPRGALGHTWSLGIEEQFYLVWPIVLCVVPMAFRATRRFAMWFAAVALISVVLGRVLVAGVLDYPHWLAIPFLDFEGLALGCLLAAMLHTDDAGRWRVPRWLFALACAGVTFDLFAADWYLPHDTYDIRGVALSACFVVVLAELVTNQKNIFAAPLQTSLMRWLGRLSYSLYLWHATIFTILSEERYPDVPRALLVTSKVVLSFAAAWLSYRLIERPAIEFGRRVRQRARHA
ncbi:MAG: acyltransferase [Actinomycetia bacterium]|nr:acyltransferase [Actinomycetes bacterium]